MDEGITTFDPSKDWFNKHLLGKEVAQQDTTALKALDLSAESPVIDEHCFMQLTMNGGFHSIQFADSSIIEISSASLVGATVHSADKVNLMKLQNMLKDRVITNQAVSALLKLKIRTIATTDGSYSLKYKMSPSSKSLLLHRECRDLPFTSKVADLELGEYVTVTTEKTVKYIEQNNLTRVPVRILLDCKSEHGICAHCYGLKFSSLQFPKVGDYVGTESAQAIGEPSAQLTISLVNQGGTAGAAINDGVKRFSSLLDGSIREDTSALVAPRSGYVTISKLGQTASISVRPVNKSCELCIDCAVDGKCPDFKPGKTPECAINNVFDVASIICKDGEWVEAGQPITNTIVSPNVINTVTIEDADGIRDTTDFKYVQRRKQVVWLDNYFYTFSDKGIDINARHFEILARIQNLQGVVYYSDNPEFEVGESYEITSLQKAEGTVRFTSSLSSRDDVIINTSGAMTALSFERIQSVAAKLCVRNHKSSYAYNNSLLGSLAVGTDLITCLLYTSPSPRD